MIHGLQNIIEEAGAEVDDVLSKVSESDFRWNPTKEGYEAVLLNGAGTSMGIVLRIYLPGKDYAVV